MRVRRLTREGGIWRVAAVLAICLMPQASVAQDGVAQSEVLTVDRERLYTESRFGQKMLAEIDARVKTLQGEDRKIEADLEAEEKDLTARRATTSVDEFRKLAATFDEKVKGIRSARDAKARDLAQQRDGAQKTFLQTAIPILADIMAERNAAAIIDRSAIILSFNRIDITDLAIARVDALLTPDGNLPTPPPAPAPPAAQSPALPPSDLTVPDPQAVPPASLGEPVPQPD